MHPESPPVNRPKLTPHRVCRRYGVSRDKVMRWIRNGELRAVNVATTAAGRPRYVIDEIDLATFERRRESRPAPKPARRRQAPADVIEFF